MALNIDDLISKRRKFTFKGREYTIKVTPKALPLMEKLGSGSSEPDQFINIIKATVPSFPTDDPDIDDLSVQMAIIGEITAAVRDNLPSGIRKRVEDEIEKRGAAPFDKKKGEPSTGVH